MYSILLDAFQFGLLIYLVVNLRTPIRAHAEALRRTEQLLRQARAEIRAQRRLVDELRLERGRLLNKLIEARTVPGWADGVFGSVEPPPEEESED